MGANFVINREQSRHKAFKQLQLEIMDNCAILSPDYFNPKDLINLSMEIERFLKDNPEVTGSDKSNLDLISEFLRGEDIVLTPPAASDSDSDQEDEGDDSPEPSVRII